MELGAKRQAEDDEAEGAPHLKLVKPNSVPTGAVHRHTRRDATLIRPLL